MKFCSLEKGKMRFAILSAIVLLAVCQTALGNPLTSSTKITKQTIEFVAQTVDRQGADTLAVFKFPQQIQVFK